MQKPEGGGVLFSGVGLFFHPPALDKWHHTDFSKTSDFYTSQSRINPNTTKHVFSSQQKNSPFQESRK